MIKENNKIIFIVFTIFLFMDNFFTNNISVKEMSDKKITKF